MKRKETETERKAEEEEKEERPVKTEERIEKLREELERKIKEEKEKREFLESMEMEREFLERLEEKREKVEVAPLPVKPVEILRPLIQKPSPRERLGIRILFIFLALLILAGVITFWYWFFKIRKPAPPPPPLPEKVKQVEEILKSAKIPVPPSLISVEETLDIEITNLGELPNLLSLILKGKLPENQFTRIVIKNLTENKVISLREFLETFGVKKSEGFLEKLEEDFTLFVYSSKDQNRLGFLVKIKEKEGLEEILRAWEKTMEEDFETLSQFLGKTSKASRPAFKETKYQDYIFRCLSFPGPNFGICYGLIKNFFVLSFSGESILRTIDKI